MFTKQRDVHYIVSIRFELYIVIPDAIVSYYSSFKDIAKGRENGAGGWKVKVALPTHMWFWRESNSLFQTRNYPMR